MAFNHEIGIELLENEESVCDADWSFEQTAARADLGGRMLTDETAERGFELATRLCEKWSVLILSHPNC